MLLYSMNNYILQIYKINYPDDTIFTISQINKSNAYLLTDNNQPTIYPIAKLQNICLLD